MALTTPPAVRSGGAIIGTARLRISMISDPAALRHSPRLDIPKRNPIILAAAKTRKETEFAA
jgi:hypothetical protein